MAAAVSAAHLGAFLSTVEIADAAAVVSWREPDATVEVHFTFPGGATAAARLTPGHAHALARDLWMHVDFLCGSERAARSLKPRR